MGTPDIRDSVSRRRAIELLGAGAATMILAGCAGPGTTSTKAGNDKNPFSGKATGDVSFYHWRGEDKATFATLIKRFEKKNPKITITQTITTSNNYNSVALQKARAGGVGDVLPSLRGPQFTSFAKAGIFVDLSDQPVAKDYNPGLMSAGKYQGKQLGFPYQLLLLEPVINEDLFDKAGADIAPKDWPAFLSVCEKLKSTGVVPISFPGGDSGNAAQIFSAMVLGEEPSEDACSGFETGKTKVTDDWFLKVLKKYQQLGQYFQPNFMGTSYNSADQLFASGKAGMVSTGSYDLAQTRKRGGEFPLNMIFPVTLDSPKDDWYKGVYNATFILGVNTASKVKPAALKWLEFLSTTENAQYYANQTAQWVTVKDVEYTNKDLNKIAPVLKEKLALAPKYQILNQDIATAVFTACTDAAQGKNVQESAEKAQKIIDQARSA